ncbi:MAG: butyrate kinase [Bacillota bacterium]|nr:butyrate kinase [Bacillota bacterium]MDW7683865.1 butyrate kinase [Bacillota bacterium]
MEIILAVNPGSTSTKIGLFSGEECLVKEVIRHPEQDLAGFASVMDQAPYRRKVILETLQENGTDPAGLSAIVVRGGLLRPLEGGVWLVGEEMVADLSACRYGTHASNLGGVIAYPVGRELKIPVFTVDPVTVDEFEDVARYSGLKNVRRLSMSHALNMKAVARKAANALHTVYEELNLVVAHLGSGISVSAHRRGKMVDVNNANNEGPFSLERSGTLPALALIDLCYNSGRTEQEMKELVTSAAGVYSYLGTKDFQKVTEKVLTKDAAATAVVGAMAYQVAKEIGAMAAVLHGGVDRVILTGGMAYSTPLVEMISEQVRFIAPVELMPGEEELEALAAGALRVLRGHEEAKIYK